MEMKIINEIKGIVKDHRRVFTEEVDLYSYAYDASFGLYLPEIVVQPLTKEEISQIVKLANREKIGIYPRGHGTNLSGGSLAIKRGIVLDLTLMNDKLVIESDDLVAIVSPGIKTIDIQKKAEEYGLFYPPDPSSSHVSTIGGNLAENSGGPRGLKYGVTKDYVIGLEVVTPTGEVIRTGGKTIKNVAGYDLTKLIVGSEGTLGIITEAILRLIPKPQATSTLLVVFNDLLKAGSAISKILTNGVLPAKIELVDQASMQAVEAYQPLGLPVDKEAILLIELDGNPNGIIIERELVKNICRELGAEEVRIAEDKKEEERLWHVRKLISPAISRIKPTKISEDATVPRSKIPELFARLKEIKEKYQLNLVVFGHAGDGNLHPNILADIRDKEEMKRVELAIEELFQATIYLGGTLSGEHGIGILKAPFMPLQFSETELKMMKLIKEAWDPKNIMNPGKIFPDDAKRMVLSE